MVIITIVIKIITPIILGDILKALKKQAVSCKFRSGKSFQEKH